MHNIQQDKILAIKNAWHFIEDFYGVGELTLQLLGGSYVRLNNDNPQQFLFVYHSLTGDSQAYTHIESWLHDVSAKDIKDIDDIVTWTTKRCKEEMKSSLKRCWDGEDQSIKRQKLSHC